MDSSTFEFGPFHWSEKGCFTKYTSRVANSIYPDEMARYEPSHLDLCCLQISVKASLGMNELINSWSENCLFGANLSGSLIRWPCPKHKGTASPQYDWAGTHHPHVTFVPLVLMASCWMMNNECVSFFICPGLQQKSVIFGGFERVFQFIHLITAATVMEFLW